MSLEWITDGRGKRKLGDVVQVEYHVTDGYSGGHNEMDQINSKNDAIRENAPDKAIAYKIVESGLFIGVTTAGVKVQYFGPL